MRPGLISTAATEYYKRPADERFETFGAMIDAARADRQMSHEAHYNLRDLTAVAPTWTPDEITAGAPPLLLASPVGQATMTHYSFGQLMRSIGGSFPRGTRLLRDLPPAIAAQAINHGLQEAAAVGTVANLLVRDDPAQDYPVARAATSETYGRVWDAQLYGEMDRHFGDGKSSNGGTWITPPAWPGSLPSGQYRGDRDSFVIRVDGGSIVTDPSLSGSGDGGQLYRGIMVRNSEVGHCSVTIECVLYRYICGNHNLWGAIIDQKFRRRHVGTKITRDVMSELASMAWKFNQRSAKQDEQIIRTLIDHEIAASKEAVIDELKKMGATKEQATEAYAACEQHEKCSPRSFWGIAQGMTRNSQESGHQDERLALDTLAAAVLKRGKLAYATV